MTVWIFIALSLTLVKPLRRFYLRHAAFCVPATGGLFGGWFLARIAVDNGGPPIVMIAWPLMMAAVFGEAGLKWFRNLEQ